MRFTALRTALSIVVAATALLGSARAQSAEPPVYYPLIISAKFWNYLPGGFGINLVDEKGNPAWLGYGGAAGTNWTSPHEIVAWVVPGKAYKITGTADSGCNFSVSISRGPGDPGRLFALKVNGAEATGYTRGSGSHQDYIGLFPVSSVSDTSDPLASVSGLRGGAATSLLPDKPIWYVGLGRTRAGHPAGGLGFRRPDFSVGTIYTPAALIAESVDSTEVEVVRPGGGAISQVRSREVFINVDTISSTSYRLDVYRRDQSSGPPGGPFTFSGQPFVQYTVAQTTLAEGTGISIERLESSTTWKTSLVYGGSKWTFRDWRLSTASATPKVETDVALSPVFRVTPSGWTSSGATTGAAFTWHKTYDSYPWGHEVGKVTFGPNETVKSETTYTYYASSGSGGALERRLKWMIQPDGSWERFLYYGAGSSQGERGQVQRVLRPWGDGPATPDLATTANSVYEDWTYTLDESNLRTLPASRYVYAPGGSTILGKTLWQHTTSAGTLNGMTYVQSVESDFWGSGTNDKLTTTVRRFRHNVSSAYYRGRTISVLYPDDRKDSYAYFFGTWNAATREFTASAAGEDRLELCFHGQTADGTQVNAWSMSPVTWQMDPVRMVAGKSTVSETVTDSKGRIVLRAENVFVSSTTIERIGGTLYRYNDNGLLTDTVDIARSVGATEFKTTRTYAGGLLDTETAEDGVATRYEYDDLLRLVKRTQGYGGSAPYPARVEETKYDGAGRVQLSYSCECGSSPTTRTYDPAGRIDTISEPSPSGGAGLITDYTYDTVRKTTTGLPTGATRIVESYLDGRPKSVTGSAVAPQSFTYQFNTTGLVTRRRNGSDDSNGWVEEQRDWLGRVIKVSVPAWQWNSGNNNIIDRHFDYNPKGQLWRERTLYRATGSRVVSDTVYAFDSGGRLVRRGLDFDNGGSLVDASQDRHVLLNTYLEKDSWGWRVISTVDQLQTANSATTTRLSTTISRLTGFYGGALAGDGSFVAADVVAIDASGRWSVDEVHIHPGNRRRRAQRAVQGINTWAWQESINGYAAGSLSHSGVSTALEYDSRGRLQHAKSRKDGNVWGSVTTYAYHDDTEYVSSVNTEGIITTYAYAWNADGTRKVTATDPAAGTTHTLYSALGLPWRVWGSAAQPVQFGYDALGRRTSMTTWRSGSFAAVDWPASPGTGATTTWALEQATGLLHYKLTADSMATVYGYDPLGRMNYRSWVRRRANSGLPHSDPESAVITRWVFSPTTGELTNVNYNDATEDYPTTPLAFSYHRTGRPHQITDATGTRTLAWRGDLQLNTETLASGFYGANRTVSPTYDDSVPGRVTGLQFKSGATTQFAPGYTFDPTTGRIATATGIGATLTMDTYTAGTDWLQKVTSGSYNRTNSLLPAHSVLGRVETRWGPGTNLGTYDSTSAGDFNTRGLRAKSTHTGSIPTAGNYTYGYNARHELTGADWSVGAARDFTWSFDTMGKRTESNQAGSSTPTTYSAVTNAAADVNQYASISGETGLNYDLDGNLAADGTWTYRYDAENRLVSMKRKDDSQSLEFTYDYLGRRVRKIVRDSSGTITAATKFVWSGWRLQAELDAGSSGTGSTLTKTFLWGQDFSNGSGAAGGAGGLLAVRQGGVTYFPAYDVQGNVTGYINASSGAVAAAWDYNPFGEIVASSGSTASFAYGFATQYTDRESGLVYYGMRYYQPKHGRFINRDPIEEAGGLNLYSFVGNSPTGRWDVLGLRFRLSDLPDTRTEDDRSGGSWGSGYWSDFFGDSAGLSFGLYISRGRSGGGTRSIVRRPSADDERFNARPTAAATYRSGVDALGGQSGVNSAANNSTPASESGAGRMGQRSGRKGMPETDDLVAAGAIGGVAIPIERILLPTGEAAGREGLRVGARVFIRTAAGVLQAVEIVAIVGDVAVVGLTAPLVFAPVTTNNPYFTAVQDLGRPRAHPLGTGSRSISDVGLGKNSDEVCPRVGIGRLNGPGAGFYGRYKCSDGYYLMGVWDREDLVPIALPRSVLILGP